MEQGAHLARGEAYGGSVSARPALGRGQSPGTDGRTDPADGEGVRRPRWPSRNGTEKAPPSGGPTAVNGAPVPDAHGRGEGRCCRRRLVCPRWRSPRGTGLGRHACPLLSSPLLPSPLLSSPLLSSPLLHSPLLHSPLLLSTLLSSPLLSSPLLGLARHGTAQLGSAQLG